MTNNTEQSRNRNLVTASMMAALIFLGTFIIKIPIPSGAGYVHLGDGFIYLASAFLALPWAIPAAAVGAALADLAGGYAAYAVWTAIIKALCALAMCLIAGKKPGFARGLAAVLIAGVINVGGYAAADTMLFSGAAAIASLPMNALQSVFGGAVYFLLLPVFRRVLSRLM